ncbi:MAG: thioredoxin-dependent thiol peroxidase [Arsenophonus sp. ET-YP4-MAG3]
MSPLKPGDKAPQFSLPDQNSEMINLSDYLGQQVLIYFYPKAMTPGCTIQACRLRDEMHKLEQMNVQVFGVSTDKPEKLLCFTEKEMLNFTLLSDYKHEVAEKFGVWGKKQFMGKTFDGIHRVSFLINKKGDIKYVFDTFKITDHHKIILNYLNTHL